jgi:hypothetical protein
VLLSTVVFGSSMPLLNKCLLKNNNADDSFEEEEISSDDGKELEVKITINKVDTLQKSETSTSNKFPLKKEPLLGSYF